MRYTDLIFDLYGTLVDIHTEEDETVWSKTALFFSYFGALYTGETLKTDLESEISKQESVLGQQYEVYPDIPIDEVMAELFRRKGIVTNALELGFHAAQLFRIASTEYIRLYAGVLDALQDLRNAGFRLWLLSNAQRTFTAFELQALGLSDHFNGIYLSSDYRCRKPDARFFQALIEEQQLDPKRCLMIGNDRETDIAGAKAVGFSTLYMHTNLTPAHQKPANLNRLPGSSNRRLHFEYEGANWSELSVRIRSM